MARTSAKAKKQKKELLKSKDEATNKEHEEQESKSSTGNGDAYDSTDKENDDNNYEVEKIVHTRMYRGKRQYLVRWKGYKEDSDTWENESAIQSCTEALDLFRKENPSSETPKDDSEADDEDSQDDAEEKETKKSKKGSAKKTAKKGKNKANKEKTEDQDEVIGETEEDEEKSAKKRKQEASESPTKKVKFSEDDDAVTDGVNYEVEKILEVHTKKDGRREFLIRWKGYKPSEDTWEPEAHLNCKEMIAKFMERVEQAKSIPARELREVRAPPARFIPTGQAKGRGLRNSGFRPCYQE